MIKELKNTVYLPLLFTVGCSIVHLPPKSGERNERQPKQEQPAPIEVEATPESTAVSISQTLFFENNSTELTLESSTWMEQLLQQIKGQTYTEIRVIGHTDTKAATAYNNQLSQQRAEYIASRLSQIGMDPKLITIQARGESEPLIPTDDGISDVRNRRVTIELR